MADQTWDSAEFKRMHKRVVEEAVARDVAVIGQEMVKTHGAVMAENKRRLDEHQERIEEMESRASSPGKTGELSSRDREHTKLFIEWKRKPSDPGCIQRLATFEAEHLERKDITVGTGAAGGFAVPEEIAREIGRLERKFSPVRDLVRVVRASSGDFKMLVDKTGATSGWVAETGTRSATLTPTLRERVPTFGELYAYPQASESALDDIFFNVEAWLADTVAREFARQTGIAVISGNGISKPTGLLNTAPVTTADFASPERSANAYQIGAQSDLTPGGVAILPDSLLDLVYSLHSSYRAGASWVMNSATAGAIRKLKDADGQYLWAQGLIAGQPDRLLGYPVAVWEDVADIAAGAFPVLFGDFNRGYMLIDRTDLRILRDPYTNPGFVRFYVRRRLGGNVWDNHAVRALQTL